ncbi:ATP-binding cassette domain-containing protein [Micropruina sp.]|uniref:ATP-binding cassette domain-containing protein n=1 Tax=Micropruina sp. TaxID=2737536 RepID=UPI0039E2185A
MTSPPPTGPALLHYCLFGAQRDLLASIGSAFVRQLAFLAVPWLLGRAVLSVAEGDGAAVAQWAGLLALATVVEFAGLCGWVWWANLAEARLAGTLRGWLLATVFADPDGGRATTDGYGDLLSRAMDDVDRVLFWIHGLATWIVVATTVVVLVPALAAMDPLLLVVAAAVAAVLVVANLVFPRAFERRMQAMARAQATRTQAVTDLLAGLVGLRGIGGAGTVVERHHRSSAVLTDRVGGVAAVSAAWSATGQTVAPAGVAAGLLIGGLAAVNGQLDVGQLTTFALWMGTVQRASQAVVMRLGDRGAARVSADRIAAVLALHPGASDDGAHAGRMPAASGTGGVAEAEGLRLSALTVDRLKLAPLTACAQPGEWLALSGPTGSGKSTLLRAIAGLEPHAGLVGVDGLDLAGLPATLRYDRLTLVPQSPLLLRGTVRDNLLLGAPRPDADPSDETLLEACRAACFDEVLDGLPGGLDTVVGERGATLSGGERQRLALARALLRGTSVLLLDDVSSALDPATEAELIRRLRTRLDDTAVVWAGHRAAVRAASDRTVELAVGADA